MHKHVGFCAMFEQFHPTDMLDWCCQAERLGFGGIMASDHFQPWTPRQGHSAFVWTWLGALGARTSLPFCTGVTPPGYRYHPAVLAQAAATVEAMFPGRFWLGLGAGEALNEHVVGGYWPEAPVRVQRLLEAIPLLQRLLRGETVRHRSEHFQMESCRLWTLPEKPPPIFVATAGPYVAFKTGELCDGLITVGAAEEKIRMLLGRFEEGAIRAGKDPARMPRLVQLHVSWAPTQAEAEENALREWPNGGMNFPKADIRSPQDFEAMARLVRLEHFAGRVMISADLAEHARHLQRYFDYGFDGVYVHNVGRNQSEFLQAYAQEVLPRLRFDPPARA